MPEPTTVSDAAGGTPRVVPAASEPSEAALRFLRTPGRFAVVATIDPDGEPHQAVVWYLVDGTTIVVNSAVGRRWPRNLARDPRISLAVADEYDWVSVIGTVDTIQDQGVAQADIAAMAKAYEDRDEAAASIARFRGQRRVTFRIVPRRIHEELEEAD
jgi:PPOX class probable F420-dependent enzyme